MKKSVAVLASTMGVYLIHDIQIKYTILTLFFLLPKQI